MTPLTLCHTHPTAPSYPIIVRADQWQNPLATTASMPWGTDRRARMSSLTICRVCSPILHPLARQQRSPRKVVSSACVYDEPGASAALRRNPAGSRLFVPCIESPLAQPPLGPRSPESRTYAQNVVPFAPNTPFSAHPAEVDCTLSTTPTIHRTTPPRNGGFYYHRTPVTACRRRVAALWSQFPPRPHPQPPTTPPTAGPATTKHNRQPRPRPCRFRATNLRLPLRTPRGVLPCAAWAPGRPGDIGSLSGTRRLGAPLHWCHA